MHLLSLVGLGIHPKGSQLLILLPRYLLQLLQSLVGLLFCSAKASPSPEKEDCKLLAILILPHQRFDLELL